MLDPVAAMGEHRGRGAGHRPRQQFGAGDRQAGGGTHELEECSPCQHVHSVRNDDEHEVGNELRPDDGLVAGMGHLPLRVHFVCRVHLTGAQYVPGGAGQCQHEGDDIPPTGVPTVVVAVIAARNCRVTRRNGTKTNGVNLIPAAMRTPMPLPRLSSSRSRSHRINASIARLT